VIVGSADAASVTACTEAIAITTPPNVLRSTAPKLTSRLVTCLGVPEVLFRLAPFENVE